MLQPAGTLAISEVCRKYGMEKSSTFKVPRLLPHCSARLAQRLDRLWVAYFSDAKHAETTFSHGLRKGRAFGWLNRNDVVSGTMHAGINQQSHNPWLIRYPGTGRSSAFDDFQ